MIVGYARTSTNDQVAGLEAQIRDLKAKPAECEKIFSEQLSSVDAIRPQLEAAIEWCRSGDELVVTKLDRLARSIRNLIDIQERLAAKGVSLRILNLGLDTGTPTGKLILNTLGCIAQFEREIMLERQREGIRKAHAQGKFKGRVPTARRRADRVLALHQQNMKAEDIAEEMSKERDQKGRPMKISARSVYRILAEQNAAQ